MCSYEQAEWKLWNVVFFLFPLDGNSTIVISKCKRVVIIFALTKSAKLYA